MKPQTIGRVLGVGVRVAGRMAGQHLSNAGQAAARQSVAGPAGSRVPARPNLRDASQAAGRVRGGLAQGLRGFLRPFSRVGGILWLEVTGVFFLLPVLVFTPTLWRTRFSYLHGPDHRTFWAAALVVVVFLYLGVSSFVRARRK